MSLSHGNRATPHHSGQHDTCRQDLQESAEEFVNLIASWVLRHSSDDAVRTAALNSLLSCHCDTSDRDVARLHSKNQTTEAAMCFLGTSAFVFVFQLFLDTDVLKLGKLSELKKLKKKNKRFEVLCQYVVDDPRALVLTCCSWYRVWNCKTAILAFSTYISHLTHSPQAEEYAFSVMEPEFLIILLRQLFKILQLSYGTDAADLDPRLTSEIGQLVMILTRAVSNADSATRMQTALGQHATIIYSLLLDILSWGGQQKPLGPVRTSMLQALYLAMLAIFRRLGSSLKLPFPPTSALLTAPSVRDFLAMKYYAIFSAMASSRRLTSRGNAACCEFSSLSRRWRA